MLALVRPTIPAMSEEALSRVRQIEAHSLTMPQVPVETAHEFHAGMYARTVMLPAGAMLTGALIKIPTLLIFSGDATVLIDGEAVRFTGYGVIPAAAGRKQVFVAHADTYLTMIFPSSAITVEAAEDEFTDEAENLMTRKEAL